jgi:mitofilin
MYPQVSGEKKVTIPHNSGLAARPAQPSTSGTPSGASKATTAPSAGRPDKTSSTGPGMTSKTSEPAKPADISTSPAPAKNSAAPAERAAVVPVAAPVGVTATVGPPITLLDTMHIENAADPVVQEITKMLNDLITVVNADKAQDKYSTTIQKAKEDISKVAKDMANYRAMEAQTADKKILDSQLQFDEGARELIKRVKQDQEEQELRWRQEYEAERERLAKAYEDKLQADVEAAQRVGEQNMRNALLEQEIKLKEYFTTQVRERVETERGGRLSKITELQTELSELEQLTSKWNEVVDSNLKTQHLNVAVDAVKSVLQSADRPKPFLHELVALKEIASDDPVVNAAIASINPTAYQRGVPTIAQLVDRFRRVASEVRKAALLPEDAGVASHAASFLLSKVMFRKNGLAEGDDVESILTRAETFLEEGELDEAAREMNGLQGWAKVLSKDWLAETRRVLEVKQALDVSSR